MISYDTALGRTMAGWKPETRRFYRELGYRIKATRIKAGLTQREVAKELGFTRASVCHIERGQRQLLLHLVFQLSTILKVPVAELLELKPGSSHGRV